MCDSLFSIMLVTSPQTFLIDVEFNFLNSEVGVLSAYFLLID